MAEIAREGLTMRCVTHEMGFAREVADRMILIDHEAILEEAAPDRFFMNPKKERAKQFLDKVLSHQ
jgi:polar amino acid transport system ATP-binding protein